MKKQIVGAFALLVFTLGLVSVFTYIQREKTLELHWLTENSRSQLDLMSDLLQNDLEKMKNQVAHVATLMESGQIEEAQKNLGMFIGVAALNLETSEFIWKVQAVHKPESIAKDEWASQWVQKTKEFKADDSEMKFFVSQTAQGEIRSALSIQANVRDHRTGQVNKVRLIGMRSQAFFQDYIDKLKVQGIHIFLTTQSGLTLAHSISEYVGNSMLGDRTYEQIRSDKNVFGKIITQDVQGDDILSFFVKLPVGKLTLVSQWRKQLWISTDWSFYGQGLFFILAFALLAGALLHFFLNKFEKDLLRKQTGKIKINDLESNSTYDGLTQGIASSDLEAERNNRENQINSEKEDFKIHPTTMASPPIQGSVSVTSKQVIPQAPLSQAPTSSGVGGRPSVGGDVIPIPSRPPSLFSSPITTTEFREPHVPMRILDKVVSTLRAPLLSVLGHVQMAKLNPMGSGLQSIETEIRSAKEVLDQVGQYSGQAHIPSVTIHLYELVESALRNVEGSILRNNIKIIREISSDLAVKCDIDDLRVALTAIFKNSIEAMENSLKKNLFIRANKINNTIVFEIEDTGEGIKSEFLEKVMDPFFTTRSPLDHSGLGLSIVSGIMRQHSGQLQIKSKFGEGTTIIIKMPTSQEVVQTLASCMVARAPKFEVPKAISGFDDKSLSTTDKMKDGFVDNTVDKPFDKAVDSTTAMPAHFSMNNDANSNFDFKNNTENELFKSLNLFDDEDSIGDFQFGRLEFSDEINPMQPKQNNQNNIVDQNLSLGEKAAQSAMQEILESNQLNDFSLVDEEAPVVPSSKLKKKEEPSSKIKVNIPRPEEKL